VSGKHSRDKGRRWEQEVARRLREVFPDIEIRRGQQGDGAHHADVVCPLIHVEAKAGSAWTYESALQQAIRDADARKWPVVMAKRDRGMPVALMPLDDFLELLTVLWREVRPVGDVLCRLEPAERSEL